MARCLSASGLNCLFVFLLSFFASFPLCGVNSEKVSFGVLPPSFPLRRQTRPPELGLQIVTCVKQHLIWSRRCPSASVTRFWCFYRQTGAGDPSSSKRRERRRGRGLAVAAEAGAIEVITEGWNCRLWNRALLALAVEAAESGGKEGAENQNTELSIAPSELRRGERSPEKKKSVQFALRRDIN